MTLKPTRPLSPGAIRALSSLLVATVATPAFAVTIPTVPVGNAGNAGDTEVMFTDGTSGYGAVAYDYRIGTTEVTNAQYAAFLNAKAASDPLGLYNTNMGSDPQGGIARGGADGSYTYTTIFSKENMPVVFVSWYDAIRFANWLHNGQGSGDTETGAYTLLGGMPTPSNGLSITRNPGAVWVLTSEDEWYKAAYHKDDGATGNYWDFPTSTDSFPNSDEPPGSDAPDQSNTANFFQDDGIANGYDDGFAVPGDLSQIHLTTAGAYTLSTSPYDTYDQGGNVGEWNEALISGSFRGARGGTWDFILPGLAADYRASGDPTLENDEIGFRVGMVPEPSTAVLAILGCVLTLWRTRKRK